MKVKVTRRAGYFLLAFIFGLLTVWGLAGSKWYNAYTVDWRDLDTQFMSFDRFHTIPYIMDLGDINGDKFRDVLVFDSYEKSLYYYNSAEIGNTDKYPDTDSLVNLSLEILSGRNAFDKYGKSVMAVYTITQLYGKQILWVRKFDNFDIMKVMKVGDLDGDGVGDLVLSLGRVKTLPALSNYKASDYKSLFGNYPTLFREYFIIDRDDDRILITPRYLDYILLGVSGRDGNVLFRSDLSGLNFNYTVVDYITPTGPGTPDLILLSVNLSAPRYYSPLFYKHLPINYEQMNFTYDGVVKGTYKNITEFVYGWKITALNLSSLSVLWSINPIPANESSEEYLFNITLGQMGYWFLGPYVSMTANVTLYSAMHIELTSFGGGFLVKMIPQLCYFGDLLLPIHYFHNVTITAIFNATDGKMQWFYGPIAHIIDSPYDTDGDGYGQIAAYDIANDSINIYMLDSIDGHILSKAVITENYSDLIRPDNPAMRIFMTYDDAYGNDGFPEIVIIAFDPSHYIADTSTALPDPVQFARINMNNSSELTVKIGDVADYGCNFYNYTDVTVLRTNIDYDGDGILDFILLGTPESTFSLPDPGNEDKIPITHTVPISGSGRIPTKKYLNTIYTPYLAPSPNRTERIPTENRIFLFRDPLNTKRSSMIISWYYGITYIQDINIFRPNTPFVDFFEGASFIIIGILIMVVICAVGFISGLKFGRDNPKTSEEDSPFLGDKHRLEIRVLGKIVFFGSVILLLLTASTIYFFTYSIDLNIGWTDAAISPEGQLIWFIIMYPAVFIMLIALPELYSLMSVPTADKFFIETQRKLFELLYEKTGRKTYRILVVDIPEKEVLSPITRISRMLLPIFISFTIGIFIYTGLGPDGIIYNSLYPFIDHPLTHPEQLGVITEDMVNPDRLWTEIGTFARYCIVPMMITYLFTSLIIPGAWLLDDAGICFFEQALHSREVSDVDSISRFFLNFISGIFGFTAVMSFLGLFGPMFAGLDELMVFISRLTTIPAWQAAVILVLTLVIFPFFIGFLLILSAQYKMEIDLKRNVKRIYKRLEMIGAITEPIPLENIFSKTSPKKNIDVDTAEFNGKTVNGKEEKESLPEKR